MAEKRQKKKTAEEELPEKELSPEEKAQARLREFLLTMLELLIVAVLVFLFLRFVAFRSVVQGDSMNTNLHDRDNLVVERVSYYFHDPERFDIVVFHSPVENDRKEHYIKRVIGLPGEAVEIREGQVYIDGVLLSEDVYGIEKMYADPYSRTKLLDYGPVSVPEGEIFVLGDNRNNSKDSRSPAIGTVPEKLILGRVFLRIWPLNALKRF